MLLIVTTLAPAVEVHGGKFRRIDIRHMNVQTLRPHFIFEFRISKKSFTFCCPKA